MAASEHRRNPKIQEPVIIYACNCSRKQIRDAAPDGIYPKTCRLKNVDFEEKNAAWRIAVPDGTTVKFTEFQRSEQSVLLAKTVGDFVVRQKNGLPAYQLASVVDDAHFGINFIVRGSDLRDSTAAQVFLSEQIGLSDFTKNTFFHHDLLMETDGSKLSKSSGAASLADWRNAQKSPQRVIQQAAAWLGLPADISTLDELLTATKRLFN